MKLYEVIFWGTEGLSQYQNDEDTIYLVRAQDFRAAVQEVSTNALPVNHQGQQSHMPHVVFEIGVDSSAADVDSPRILRGPYYQCAYNHGWKAWYRKVEGSDYGSEWVEGNTA